jgi:peptidoglycan/LPS O-acetylase OafA/YrhL
VVTSLPSETARRLPSLTGLRFIAAFLVFFDHVIEVEALFEDPSVTEAMLRPAIAAGAMGVCFFFVLSGFVLTWSARQDDTPGRFWRRRAAKILPNHVVTWVAALVVALFAGQALTGVNLLPTLFLVQAWSPDSALAAVNAPTWSLSVEMAFYLAFPLVLALVRRIPAARLWLTAALLAGAVIALPAVVTHVLPGSGTFAGTDLTWEQFWLVYAFPPARLLEFTLGVVAARLVLTGRMPRIPLLAAGALVVAAFAVQATVAYTAYVVAAVTVVPVAALITAAATADTSGTRSPLRTRPMVWLGEISYAFFMTHFLVLHYGRLWLFGEGTWTIPGAIGVAATLLAATVLVSWALYRLVERPLSRRLGTTRQPITRGDEFLHR